MLVKGRLDPTADLPKVKDWLNQVQADAVLQTEALIAVATMTPVANVTSQTLSAQAMRIKAMFVTAGGVQYRPMEPISLERMLELRQGNPSSQSDTLLKYTFLGLSEIEFYPTPRGTETITLYYVRQPSTMVNNTDTPELPEPFGSKLLEYGALAEAADFKRDDALQNYQQRYLEWIGKLRSDLNRKRSGIPEQMLVYGSSMFPPHDPSTDIRWW